MAGNGVEEPAYKLSLLAQRQHLPVLPGQEADTKYGVVWSTFPMPAQGSCYIVRFNDARSVSFLAYIDDRGAVFPVDGPITLAPDSCPDLAASPDESGFSGTVYVRDGGVSLSPLSKYRGSFKGTMREVSDVETWNTKRSLTYRPFMASLYLRYCVLDPDRCVPEPIARPALDMTAHPLEQPIDLLGDLDRLTLPDAIDALRYRVDASSSPSGIELFARRLLGQVSVPRIRRLSEKGALALAFIERMDGYYINFDQTALASDEAVELFAVEAVLNRLHRVLSVMGFGGLQPVTASPSEEACSAYDQAAFAGVTRWVKRLTENAITPNDWHEMGSMQSTPGGEWDVRTRFASACERLGLLVRLDYDFRYDALARELRVSFVVPHTSCMPASRFDAANQAWRSCSHDERTLAASDYTERMALVLAAAAFSASLSMRRCVVEMRDVLTGTSASLAFERAPFMARVVQIADELDGVPLTQGNVHERLRRFETAERMGDTLRQGLHAMPLEDERPLPASLRELLMADSLSELEVMEPLDDPYMLRFKELRDQENRDVRLAERGLLELIEELEARCAAVELMCDRPTITRFCENHVGRILIPVLEEDHSVRIHRAPDALFFARYELCRLYVDAEAYERALAEARKLLDMATTSMQAHMMLVNVLARLNRFDEVTDVVKHGARVVLDRESFAYLLYRGAFAYWMLGDRETAAACYRIVVQGNHMMPMAGDELRQLLSEMERTEPPQWREAVERMELAGIAIPVHSDAVRQVVDVTKLMVDHGFFYLGSRYVHHLWRLLASDELGAVFRSLLP